MTLVPWQNGRSLVWDATCVDTLAACHLPATSAAAGAAAAAAEGLKRRKYAALTDDYIFAPFGFETLGPWGPDARRVLKEISKRLVEESGDPRAGTYLAQRISLTIQRGNGASILGTLPPGSDLGEIFRKNNKMTNTEKQGYCLNNFNSTAALATNPGFPSTISIASKDVEESKSYNPSEHRDLEHPNSTIGSALHLLKACLGSGILAMPAAFKNSGLVAGSIGTFIAGVVCTHAIHMLVKTSQELCVDAKKPSLNYAETCGAAFAHGPKNLRKYSHLFRTIADWSMAMTYISVLCVYVVFIGSTFKEVFDEYTKGNELNIQSYCALTLVPLVIICQIRNLKYLVPFSAIANILIVGVFAITLYYIFSGIPNIKESGRELVTSVGQWPLFLSTVIFAMEGVGVVMPIENEMRKPQSFLGCPGVLNVSMVIVITLYGVFGFFGYLRYGDEVKGSVTLNLPQDSWVSQGAQIFMALVIYFSYALQFYVPMELFNRIIKRSVPDRYENFVQITSRTLLVTFSVAVAAVVPNLEVVINLVGAIFLSTLGLLIPAFVDTVYRWDKSLGKFNYVLWKNVVIGIISLIALVAGSYTSILSMFSSGQNYVIVPSLNGTVA